MKQRRTSAPRTLWCGGSGRQPGPGRSVTLLRLDGPTARSGWC